MWDCLRPAEEEEGFRELRARTGDGSSTNFSSDQYTADNAIHTSKYTLLTFLPRGLFEQFRRVANVFFLAISVLMVIGEYSTMFESPMMPWSTILPLMIIIGFTLVKEGYEDSKRHHADFETNHREQHVLVGEGDGSCEEIRCMDVRVGMIVRVQDREEIPADIVPLMTSEEGGKCYIETANIDGETNLKLRNAPTSSPHGGVVWPTAAELAKTSLSVAVEPPNPAIHKFQGTLQIPETDVRTSLNASHLLLRGAVLRNTKWVLGIVVYTGSESKLVLNSRDAPSKLSIMEQQVNDVIYFIFGVYFVLVTITTITRAIWNSSNSDTFWYLCSHYSDADNTLFRVNCESSQNYMAWTYWFTFVILFSNLIPISLYVTIETINVVQAYFVDVDANMYDPVIDVPATARTSNMNGDLGQIEYIFSDKTGTLTCNEMKFRRCSVAKVVYGGAPAPPRASDISGLGAGATGSGAVEHGVELGVGAGMPLDELEALARQPSPQGRIAQSFVEVLAVCHTVVIEKNPATGAASYQAESPDEEALVLGAKQLGWTFTGKTSNTVIVTSPEGKELSYTVLALVEFTSTRKRMSVLVQCPDGTYKLMIKGADNIIIGLTTPGSGFELVGGRTALDEKLEMFAADGLRTLVLAERVLSPDEATMFLAKWNEACTAEEGRAEAMDAAAELLERDVTVLGTTAIEDRLQDDVPRTIADLSVAGVKLWVLTGDKLTTAVHIGHSCRLLNKTMHQFVISTSPRGDDDTPPPPIATQLEEAKSFLVANHSATFLAVEERLGSAPQGIVEQASAFFDQLCASRGQAVATDASTSSLANVALIIDGPALTTVFESEAMVKDLLHVTCVCRSVLACRVSPKQKQIIVRMVKTGFKRRPITLAIGDGANDVGMIQEAQIGVGIRGKEGRQAVNNSDFAIAQFRFLKRLLMVHGRWNYRRMAKVIVYFFHKNIVITTVILFYTCMSAFSGTSLFEDYVYTGYNFFLGVPPFVIGFFDQDISAGMAMKYMQTYSVGRERKDLNAKIMATTFVRALAEGTLIYFLCEGALLAAGSVWQGGTGGTAGLFVYGTVVYTAMIAGMLVKVSILLNTWNWVSTAGMAFSVFLYVFFLICYSAWSSLSYNFYWVPYHAMSQSPFWLLWILLFGLVATVDIAIRTIHLEFTDDFSDKLSMAFHQGLCEDPPERNFGDDGSTSYSPILDTSKKHGEKKRFCVKSAPQQGKGGLALRDLSTSGVLPDGSPGSV